MVKWPQIFMVVWLLHKKRRQGKMQGGFKMLSGPVGGKAELERGQGLYEGWCNEAMERVMRSPYRKNGGTI